MKRWLLRIACVLSLAAGVAAAALWFARRSLPYNTEGRHFDPGTGLVIHEQSATGFGMTALICIALALSVWMISRKR